jgi:hypothetical protein
VPAMAATPSPDRVGRHPQTAHDGERRAPRQDVFARAPTAEQDGARKKWASIAAPYCNNILCLNIFHPPSSCIMVRVGESWTMRQACCCAWRVGSRSCMRPLRSVGSVVSCVRQRLTSCRAFCRARWYDRHDDVDVDDEAAFGENGLTTLGGATSVCRSSAAPRITTGRPRPAG